MKIKTPYKNFTFSDDKSDCRFKLDVNASVVLDGQLNRFTIGQIKISPWPQDVPSQLEEMIERFIDNWFADICPQPEADYLGLLALSDYKPWVVITNARKLGKSSFVSADLSNWLPYYRQLKITKNEAETLYPRTVPQWITENHPLFKSELADLDLPQKTADGIAFIDETEVRKDSGKGES